MPSHWCSCNVCLHRFSQSLMIGGRCNIGCNMLHDATHYTGTTLLSVSRYPFHPNSLWGCDRVSGQHHQLADASAAVRTEPPSNHSSKSQCTTPRSAAAVTCNYRTALHHHTCQKRSKTHQQSQQMARCTSRAIHKRGQTASAASSSWLSFPGNAAAVCKKRQCQLCSCASVQQSSTMHTITGKHA